MKNEGHKTALLVDVRLSGELVFQIRLDQIFFNLVFESQNIIRDHEAGIGALCDHQLFQGLQSVSDAVEYDIGQENMDDRVSWVVLFKEANLLVHKLVPEIIDIGFGEFVARVQELCAGALFSVAVADHHMHLQMPHQLLVVGGVLSVVDKVAQTQQVNIFLVNVFVGVFGSGPPELFLDGRIGEQEIDQDCASDQIVDYLNAFIRERGGERLEERAGTKPRYYTLTGQLELVSRAVELVLKQDVVEQQQEREDRVDCDKVLGTRASIVDGNVARHKYLQEKLGLVNISVRCAVVGRRKGIQIARENYIELINNKRQAQHHNAQNSDGSLERGIAGHVAREMVVRVANQDRYQRIENRKGQYGKREQLQETVQKVYRQMKHGFLLLAVQIKQVSE